MIAGRVQSIWFGVSFMSLLGVFLLFLTCKLYQGAACDDQIARNSPVVCMKIITRNQGLGTLKNPDKINAVYNYGDLGKYNRIYQAD